MKLGSKIELAILGLTLAVHIVKLIREKREPKPIRIKNDNSGHKR